MPAPDRHLAGALELVRLGVFRVDAESGKVWRVARISRDGSVIPIRRRRAENVGGGGYLRITWRDGDTIRQVMAHRLIWAVVNGHIPPYLQIDHISMRRRDNRLQNLELVSQSENIKRRHRAYAGQQTVAA